MIAPMIALVLRRLAVTALTLLVVSAIIFLLLRLVPGDPAALIVGDLASGEELARVRAEMGLDRSLPAQYLIWLSHLSRGDLGTSFMTGEPVLDALLGRFAVTAQVVVLAFILSALVAIPLGLLAARHAGRAADTVIVLGATVLVSIPSFWMGLLLILLFGVQLGWLPTLGFVSIADNAAEWAQHVALPVVALICVETAILTRMVRASALEVLGQDYVAYARAKGLPEGLIMRRHVARNALAPAVTLLGLILGSLLSGTAAIETVFGIPGLGRFLVEAIYARDYPVIQGTLLFVVLVYALVNMAVDLLYPLLDPRVSQR